jgi:assimilatory nitrate reductase catalytic subunit
MTGAVRTTCPYCGVGCGILVRPHEGSVDIAGDPAHPANRGALCAKGIALAETLGLEGRLLEPRIRGATVGWNRALDAVAEGIREVIATHGPQAVALYVSGQLLTEDYYVANKLMKGFIGTANIDTNSRLCMASAVAAHQRAFGEDVVPGCYEDLDLADLIVLVGSNTAWCHPVLYRRIVAAKAARPGVRIVVIDPRRTATCDEANLHLAIEGGTDAWLFNGLLAYLAAHGAIDRTFVDNHTEGVEAAIGAASATAGEPRHVAERCGLLVADVETFYGWFAGTERVVTLFSQGVNQSSSGTDKANSLINCHLLTGRIGKPGAGPFSITGQPNAMGGREVGGLANTLAAHLDLASEADRQLVQDFWGSPRIADRAGLKAVELFEAIDAGRIRAVWIMATNPVVSLPDADRTRRALANCEFVVVSDCMSDTDTMRLAHVALPAAAWGEKDGTVTNSERCISRQRAFQPPPGVARPDWWIVSEVATRLGFADAFRYSGPDEIFAEHARLSGLRNAGDRFFNIEGLAALGPDGYAGLDPIQWPVRQRGDPGTPRLFADGHFAFANGRARFVAVKPQRPIQRVDAEFPLVLNTGRSRDQWHTMTRTGQSPRLTAHRREPCVEMHPDDAANELLTTGSLVKLVTRWGSTVARLAVTPDVGRGSVFATIHWNDVFASDGRVGAAVQPATDPVSGEPEFKYTPARVERFAVAWEGLAFSRAPLALGPVSWWARSKGPGWESLAIAGSTSDHLSVPELRSVLGADHPGADWIEYSDSARGAFRGALIHNGRLEAAVFIGRPTTLPARSFVEGLFEKSAFDAVDRKQLLGGRPLGAAMDCGRTVCACHGVGENTLVRGIAAGATEVAALGARFRAGTGCGSCIPELRALINAAMRRVA